MREVHKIKPKAGLKLRFPGIKRYVNPEGEFVEWSSYWHRRLLDGDVIIVSSTKEEKDFIAAQKNGGVEAEPAPVEKKK